MNKAQEIKKVVILAGGEGTRLSEVTGTIPKPLVRVGNEPIVVHLMREFYAQGFKEFILLVGYKGEEFKRYFRDYNFNGRSVTFTPYGMNVHGDPREDWTVHIVESGEKSETGHRLDFIRPFVGDDDFILTYGDGLSDVKMQNVIEAHYNSDNLVTITAVQKLEHYGVLRTDGSGKVTNFSEKPDNPESLINGGFMVVSNRLLDRISEESGDLAHQILTGLSNEGKLGYYTHNGYWVAIDTKRDLDRVNAAYKATGKYV